MASRTTKTAEAVLRTTPTATKTTTVTIAITIAIVTKVATTVCVVHGKGQHLRAKIFYCLAFIIRLRK